MSDWLPPPPSDDPQSLRPWKPRPLRRKNLDEFRYLLIDEIVGDSVGLSLSQWPTVDEDGRLRFAGDPLLLGADVDAFKRFLDAHRRPRQLADRPLRIGDAFAVRVSREALDDALAQHGAEGRLEPAPDPAAWIKPPLYDITSDAREEAKSSYYSAVTPRLGPQQASQLSEITMPPPRGPPWRPGRWPRSGGWPARTLGLLAGAAVLTAGVGSGTAVGRISAPERTIALTTLIETNEVTITQAGQTVTSPGTTVTKPGSTVTEPARTITEAGATVTEAGATVTETVNDPATTVMRTVTTTETTVQSTTVSQTISTTVTTPSLRTLRVSIAGLEGRILSRRLKIDCRRTWIPTERRSVDSGRCSARLPPSSLTPIDLEARQIIGGLDYEFDRWATTNPGCAKNPCRLTITSSLEIEARFVPSIG